MAQKHTQSTDLPLPQYMLCLKNSPCFARTQPLILSKAELTYQKSYFRGECGHLKLRLVDESGSASKITSFQAFKSSALCPKMRSAGKEREIACISSEFF